MQPAQPNFIAVFVGFFSLCGGVLVLAMSGDRWQTFKKMVLALVSTAFLLTVVGLTIASLFPASRVFVGELTGQLCVSVPSWVQP
jgi:hypothetical protein